MSTAVLPVLLTLEEFIARPSRDDFQKEELIEGELIVSPGPKVDHSEIVARLFKRLIALEELDFVVRNDFSCILRPRSMPVPDLAVVRRERWEQALQSCSWLEGSPELVVEVLSPSNRRLRVKADVYLEHGAEQAWLIYPKRHSVTVCTTDGTSEVRSDETLEFRGVLIPVADIFSF